MGFNLQGKIHQISEIQEISPTFRKREFVVVYNDNPTGPYSTDQFLKFELVQDRCTELDNFSVGDIVTVDFNLQGREWNSPQGEVKYFNSLKAWRINKAQAGMDSSPDPYPAGAATTFSAENTESNQSEDDLPF